MISEGVGLNSFTPSGYSLLVIMTVVILFFSIFVALRKIVHFVVMLASVKFAAEGGFRLGQNGSGRR